MKDRKENARYWRIRGYDSTIEILDISVPIGQMTENGMKGFLQALVAKDLSPLELLGAYAKRRARISNVLLEVQRSIDPVKRRTIYMCGDNPHYIATAS